MLTKSKIDQARIFAQDPLNPAQACYLVDYGTGTLGTCTPVYWEQEHLIGLTYPIHALVWADGTVELVNKPVVRWVKVKQDYMRIEEVLI